MKVLVAIEDDQFGNKVVDFILQNKWAPNSKFKVLHVIEPFELSAGLDITYMPFLTETMDKARVGAKSLVENLAIKLKNKLDPCPVEAKVIEGYAKETLLEEAEKWDADLICVGTHGRKGVSKFLIGSVSNAIVNHAPCAVLVVKSDIQSKEAETK